jgi:hypothetical protein
MKMFCILLITFCFTPPLLTMQFGQHVTIAAAVRKKSTTLHTQNRRSFSGCKCIKNFQYEPHEEHFVSNIDLNDRIKIFNLCRDLVSNKNKLQKEGNWPEGEGAVLEAALQSECYCPDFGNCTQKVRFTAKRARIAGIMSIVLAISSFVFAPVDSIVFLGCPTAIMGLAYSVYSYNKAQGTKEILSAIAYNDLQNLDTMYHNVTWMQHRLRNTRLKKDCQHSS